MAPLVGVAGHTLAEPGAFELGEDQIDPTPPFVPIPGLRWLILAKMYLDSAGPSGRAMAGATVNHPSWTYEGTVLSWGTIDRSIPVPSGLPQVADAQLRLANTDRRFRDLFVMQTPRRRLMELKFVQQGMSESAVLPFYTGEIVDFTFEEGYCDVKLRDRTFSWLDEEIPSVITRENFPGLDPRSEGAFFPIVAGNVISRTGEGALKLPHIGWSDATGDRFAVSLTPVWDVMAAFRKDQDVWVAVAPSEFNIAVVPMTLDGVGLELTFLDFLEEQPENTEIQADVAGIYFRGGWNGYPAVGYHPTGNPDGDPGVLRNPIDFFINMTYWVLRKAERELNWNANLIMNIRDKFEQLGYVCDGALTSPMTCREFLSRFCASFGLDMYQTKEGQIALHFTDGPDPLRPVFDESHLILKGSFREGLANPTVNRMTYQFEQNYARGEWESKEITENVPDQTTLGLDGPDGRILRVEEDTFDMWFVRDAAVALDVSSRRMRYLSMGSYRQEFIVPAPQVMRVLELGRLVGITHRAGLEATGYHNREAKILGITIDLDTFQAKIRTILRGAARIEIPPVTPELDYTDFEAGTAEFTDNFNRADSDTTGWTLLGSPDAVTSNLLDTCFKINDNEMLGGRQTAPAFPNGVHAVAFWPGATAGFNQYVKVTIGETNDWEGALGVFLRGTGTGASDIDGVACQWLRVAGDDVFRIYNVYPGAPYRTLLVQNNIGTSLAIGLGDELEFWLFDDTAGNVRIFIFVRGFVITWASIPAAPSAGKTGFYTDSVLPFATGIHADDFQTGPLVEV